ncbi:P-loop NTPase [Sphingomonas sp. ID0503]|uniref:Mrp/NBP35 family ATP-binding protein n=1 Tax=Sphingomonas sp. ID0503 TaxID=3399691 RepID=UPI003AFA491B
MTDALTAALDAIPDPLTGRGLVAAGRATAPRLTDATASLVLDITGLVDPKALEQAVTTALSAVPGVATVRIALTQEKRERRIIAVGSGKGGVGKSTVAANLAIALARMGQRVGLVDADIYGPSQPRLLGMEAAKPTAKDKVLDPIPTPFGVLMLSIGQLVAPGKALAWRGPMISGALGQLLDADWGTTDLLVVDLPPGTGDIQIGMIQKYKPAGAVIVSTPQDLALIDAARAIDLFAQTNVPILGLVENMAGYACPHCGEISDPFGTGGAENAAAELALPFLGRIPLDIAIRTASDAGQPPAATDSPQGRSFTAIAEKVAAALNLRPA